MRDAGQGLVEGGRVAVICERNADAPGEQPPGQGEGLLVLQEPGPEAVIVDLLPLG